MSLGRPAPERPCEVQIEIPDLRALRDPRAGHDDPARPGRDIGPDLRAEAPQGPAPGGGLPRQARAFEAQPADGRAAAEQAERIEVDAQAAFLHQGRSRGPGRDPHAAEGEARQRQHGQARRSLRAEGEPVGVEGLTDEGRRPAAVDRPVAQAEAGNDQAPESEDKGRAAQRHHAPDGPRLRPEAGCRDRPPQAVAARQGLHVEGVF
ncbi:hypothetical protein [Methylobacterium tardum]|uniref:hypothetical protein n=1 Tax=Methylobacterium tardum TaxID=374432 RepID=UPI00360FE864